MGLNVYKVYGRAWGFRLQAWGVAEQMPNRGCSYPSALAFCVGQVTSEPFPLALPFCVGQVTSEANCCKVSSAWGSKGGNCI